MALRTLVLLGAGAGAVDDAAAPTSSPCQSCPAHEDPPEGGSASWTDPVDALSSRVSAGYAAAYTLWGSRAGHT